MQTQKAEVEAKEQENEKEAIEDKHKREIAGINQTHLEVLESEL